jgi:hypothetical protein
MLFSSIVNNIPGIREADLLEAGLTRELCRFRTYTAAGLIDY